MKPKISIIIIVRNDRGILNTLSALKNQNVSVSTETIVVDSSNPLLLKDIRDLFPEVLWFNFIPKDINKTSIPEQRNFGIQNARGDIIVFIDANCIPSENWLIKLTEPLLNKKETMTAGSVRAMDSKTYVNLNSLSIKNKYLSSSPTINLAFTKSLFEKVGNFDETFLFGSDVDFTWRVIDRGEKILFVREAIVTHDWGSFGDEIRRSFKYGKARAYLLLKHRNRLVKDLLGDTVYVLIYGLYIIGLPFTFLFPWYPLIIILPLLKNIKNKPFKVVFINLIYTIGFYKEFIVMSFRKIIPNFIHDFIGKYKFIKKTKSFSERPVYTIFRFIRWMFAQWTNSDISFKTPDGTHFISMSHNFSSFIVYFANYRDENIHAFLLKNLNKKSIFVDAGANIGTYTIRAGQIIGAEGKVIAIEAHPVIYNYLVKNIKLNNLDKITTFNLALGEKDGAIGISYDPSNAGETHISTDDTQKVTIPMQTLDQILSNLNISKIDYLKVDVEGFELPLLKGAEKIIKASPNIIIQTELNDIHSQRYGRPITQLIDMLYSWGLTPHIIDSQGNSTLTNKSELEKPCDVLWWRH